MCDGLIKTKAGHSGLLGAVILTAITASMLMPSPSVGSGAVPRCRRAANRASHHARPHQSKHRGSRKQKQAKIHKRVTLGATGPANPINMNDTKGIGETDIVIGASPALPSTVRSKQITLTVPKRFERSGSNMASVYLPVPTFSRPRILENGKLVAFTLCVSVNGAQAGSYVGQVIVGGPKGVQPATIAITVNAKNRTLFRLGLWIAGIVALLLLFVQAAKKRWDAKENPRLKGVALATLGDPWGFWLPTVIAVVAAVVAVYQVWDTTAAWGADTGASLIALGGTTLSATGIGGFLSSVRSSS